MGNLISTQGISLRQVTSWGMFAEKAHYSPAETRAKYETIQNDIKEQLVERWRKNKETEFAYGTRTCSSLRLKQMEEQKANKLLNQLSGIMGLSASSPKKFELD